MRLLANENLPGDLVEALREHGHDVSWVRLEHPGIPDNEVLSLAIRESRILITFDKDFGELVFRSEFPSVPGVVLLRIPSAASTTLAALIPAVLASRHDWEGSFSVIEPGRIRIIPLAPRRRTHRQD